MDIERKLASIRTISTIKPIPKADNLEVAIIDGWQAVVRKGEFKKGAKVIYCEIDSLLPIRDEYEFLRKSCYIKQTEEVEGFRIKTVVLRGQVSQGLVLPLRAELQELAIGTDLTEELGITLYDPMLGKDLPPEIKAGYPGLVPKTKQERIQNIDIRLINTETRTWRVTEKLDGMSFSCYVYQDNFGICIRNYELADVPDSIYGQITRKYDLERKLKAFGSNIVLQGELVGPGTKQKNKYQLSEAEYFIFDIFSIDEMGYYSNRELTELTRSLGLKMVPVITNSINLQESTIEDILVVGAEGKSKLNPAIEREGVVITLNTQGMRPMRTQGDIYSFKAISNKFLLKNDE